jgi:glucokinase
MNRIAHHINLLASPTAASAASGSGAAGASVPIILSGDIGGTRSRLQLWEAPSPPSGWGDSGRVQSIPGALLFEQKYLNASFGSFVDVCRRFLAEATSAGVLRASGGGDIRCASFAMAGPVNEVKNSLTFTNKSTWGVVDGSALASALSIPTVKLVNDFVANGYGLLTLKVSV